MICTFGDVTDVTWWRELDAAGARRDPARRPRCGRSTWGSAGLGVRRRGRGAGVPTTSLRASRPPRRARRSSSCCRQAATWSARPAPITHPVKFYEKGDRPLEIVTSRQWFVKTIEFRRGAPRARARAAVASAVHAVALRELGGRPERRLVRQPPALLRRAVSRLVSDRRRRPSSEYSRAAAARGGPAADRSVHRRAAGLHGRPARPAERRSSAIPTSWTRGRPRR